MNRTYTVTGTWPFPTDMLRYDGSHPATAGDEAVVNRLSAEFAPDRTALRVRVSVALVMGIAGRPQPCTARWESFGWRVLPVERGRQACRALPAPDLDREALRQSALAKLTVDERHALGL